MDAVLIRDILGKINYECKLELIEVDKRYLRDKSMDETRYLTIKFSEDDYRNIKKSKYYDYYVTGFNSIDNYLTLYIYKYEE